MKNPVIIVGLFALLVGGCKEYSADESNTATEPQPIARVQTFKLQKSTLSETLTVYGTVLPLPDKLKTLSVPYISRVEQILVNDGQLVNPGEVLLTLKPSDDAKLQLAQVRQELAAATQEQKLLQERIQLKLATQQDLVTSQLRTDQAKALLKNLTERGGTQQQTLAADRAGIIHVVNVQQGQIVPAGNPLLQLVDQNQWVVRLGVEPEDFEHLQLQQAVLIRPVNKPSAQPVKGRVEIIMHQIDPATRLLNVFVRPEPNQDLLINDFVEADITVAAKHTLVVPRAAALPEGNAYRLFTVKDGYAVKHLVQVGLENATQLEIIAEDIKEQDEVVVLGNYELREGMAVRVQQP